MSIKLYLYLRCRKGIKFINGLTRHLNACKEQIYLKLSYNIELEYCHNKDTMNKNLKDIEGDLLRKTNNIVVANGVAKMLFRHRSWKKLLIRKYLSILRDE